MVPNANSAGSHSFSVCTEWNYCTPMKVLQKEHFPMRNKVSPALLQTSYLKLLAPETHFSTHSCVSVFDIDDIKHG